MEQTNKFRTYVVALGLLLIAGLMGLFLLNSLSSRMNLKIGPIYINWKLLYPDKIPLDLTINRRCQQHVGEAQLNAYRIYEMYKQGQCADENRYCRVDARHGPMMLYLCEDPVTGIIGGLFVILEKHEIFSGFGYDDSHYPGSSNFEFWMDVINNEDEPWDLCPPGGAQ